MDKKIISCCGLYCNNCRAYIKGKCTGCVNNIKAEKRCAVKNCCKEKKISNCAECREFIDYKDCKRLNNFISKIFAIAFGSDRCACIDYIKFQGKDEYIKHMEKIKSYNNPNKK